MRGLFSTPITPLPGSFFHADPHPTWCDNRLTIRQDELDTRVLAGLASEMLRDDVVGAFLSEYEAETRRLMAETVSARPEREAELANLDHQLGCAKAAILKGVDATVFVDEMKIWTERRKVLLAELELAAQDTIQTVSPEPELLTPDLGRVYREKVKQLTAAFKDDALKAQAFERLRALIEAVVLTPEDGDLAIDLRGELASMLSLCAGAETQKASAGVTEEVLQIKMVAGTGSFPNPTHAYPVAISRHYFREPPRYPSRYPCRIRDTIISPDFATKKSTGPLSIALLRRSLSFMVSKELHAISTQSSVTKPSVCKRQRGTGCRSKSD